MIATIFYYFGIVIGGLLLCQIPPLLTIGICSLREKWKESQGKK